MAADGPTNRDLGGKKRRTNAVSVSDFVIVLGLVLFFSSRASFSVHDAPLLNDFSTRDRTGQKLNTRHPPRALDVTRRQQAAAELFLFIFENVSRLGLCRCSVAVHPYKCGHDLKQLDLARVSTIRIWSRCTRYPAWFPPCRMVAFIRASLNYLLNCTRPPGRHPRYVSPLALRSSYETCVNPEEPDFNPCVEHYRPIDRTSSSSGATSSSSSSSAPPSNPSSHSSEGGNGRNGSFVLSEGDNRVSASSDGSAVSPVEKGGGNDQDDGGFTDPPDEDGECMEESMHPLPAGTVCDHEAYK